ncbi:MAG: sulfur carrier protein ThiS [Desulfobulbaceae bacterium]|nr:sulfur carrier protein ThiS [Desulfobulbaceae bacterium]
MENGLTLVDLLTELNLEPGTVVAEINTKIIEQDQYEQEVLRDGDSVELIRFVGGG